MNHSLDIGEKLKRFRTMNRMSIRNIARKSGCAVSTVAQIQLNQISPTVGTLENICRAFDITVSDLLRPALATPKPVFISNAREGCAVALRWTGAKLLRVIAEDESTLPD
jgi:transcriptional regulator with XRE-family HTH domain